MTDKAGRGRIIGNRRVKVVSGRTVESGWDKVAGEEPMEVRVGGQAVSVTMRTPGNDFELAVGFCLTEGILASFTHVSTVQYCIDGPQEYNVVDIRIRPGAEANLSLARQLYTTSSCGVCGTGSIETINARSGTGSVATDPVRVSREVLAGLSHQLLTSQRVFAQTGGLHAAAVFSSDGEALAVREDVGRHNAVDKLVGWAAMDGRLPLAGTVLMVSGRVAFEIVQKAVYAGIPVVAAVSAPTTLAVDLAVAAGVTLIGFLRNDHMNVYAGSHRLVID